MKKIILKIDGMSCSGCSTGLEKYLNKQSGIINASVNLVLAQALIEYEDTLTLLDLERFVEEAGFKSLGVYTNEETENKINNQKRNLLIFSILAIIILYISMAHMLGLPSLPYLNMKHYPLNYTITLFILTIPFLIYGSDIFNKGTKNLFHKTPSMDTLVSLGVIASFIYSLVNMFLVLSGHYNYVDNLYFESCAIVIFFIKLGRFIDSKSKEKTKTALKELVQITPSTALLKVGNNTKKVTIDEIKKDDILICKPGMKIAVDGIITKGNAYLDEAFITGESLPTKKNINDKVIAGSININGIIEYKAKKIGKDSTISEIVRLVVEATNTKAPIQKLADKVSSYFVPFIIIIAIITLFSYLILGHPIKESLTSFVTVLVVACPCALGLATPLAIVVSVGTCAKHGILVKNSQVLENTHKVDTIVFDKTGTLTYGNLKISKVFNYSNYSDKELISLAASIENNSSHPISKALIEYANSHKIKLANTKDFKELSGIGLKATINNKEIYLGNNRLFNKLKLDNLYSKDEQQLTNLGNSIIYIIEDKQVVGLIGVKDIVRDSAKATISKLQNMGKQIIMLTGDNEKTAKIIADSLNIKEVISNVLPQDKTKVIKELISNGHNVMMVGDGINDAPSLAVSNIGVSFDNATDIATDSADIILMNDKLSQIPSLINISQRTIRNIKQNLFWAFFYNICMIPLAIGILKPYNISMNPMIASLAMTISSLTVVFNSLRLKRYIEK